MTNPPDEGTPAPVTPDYAKAIEELKATNVALVQRIVDLESKNKSNEEKIVALSGERQQATKAGLDVALQGAKSDLDKAYEKALAELGIKKE